MCTEFNIDTHLDANAELYKVELAVFNQDRSQYCPFPSISTFSLYVHMHKICIYTQSFTCTTDKTYVGRTLKKV